MWFLLALGTAFFQAAKDVLLRKSGLTGDGEGHDGPNLDGLTLAWAMSLVTAVLMTPVLLAVGLPKVAPDFWKPLAVNACLLSLTFVLYVKALQASDISVTTPMLTFTPLLLTVTSPLLVGEVPSAGGFIGIVLIVAGSYLLNVQRSREGLLGPFKALVQEPGPRMMLAVAVIWSVCANVDRMGIDRSSPLFWLTAEFWAISLVLTPLVWRRCGACRTRLLRGAPIILAAGAAEALSLSLQMYAYTFTIVPYVIAVKRLSVVFGVGFGFFFFKERHVLQRLAAAGIMVAGVACIAVL